jgi:hypothetical protein
LPEAYFAKGLKEVPHQAAASVYQKVIKGVFPEEGVHSASALDIDDCGEDDPIPLVDGSMGGPLEDAPMLAAPAPDDDEAEEFASVDWEDALADAMSVASTDDDDEKIGPALGDEHVAPGPLEPPAAEVPPALGPDPDGTLGPGLGDVAAGGDGKAEGGEAEDFADLPIILKATSWGVFRLTPRTPDKGGGVHGGYQANCPFHKRNDKSGCRKFFRILGPRPADRFTTLRRMLWWCLGHSDFDRQRKHIAWEPSEAELPHQDFMLASKILDKPPWLSVKSDVELDAEAAGLVVAPVVAVADDAGVAVAGDVVDDALLLPPPIRARGGRGRGRGGRRGAGGRAAGPAAVVVDDAVDRGRGRGRGRGRVVADPAGSSSSSSSSDSSSSSSSSQSD